MGAARHSLSSPQSIRVSPAHLFGEGEVIQVQLSNEIAFSTVDSTLGGVRSAWLQAGEF